MAEMRLDGGEKKQSGMLVPVLIALVLLAAGGGWFAKVYLHPEVAAKVNAVQVFPYVAKYAKGSSGMLVGDAQTEYVTYVIADVSLKDNTEVPLFPKAVNGSFTMEDGTVMQAQAIEKADLPRLAAMFPGMQEKFDAVAPSPLTSDTTIAPATTGHGFVVFAYNVPQAVWDKRKGADVSVDFYHQDRVTVALPK